tara:strand:+ start:73 stop:525 length:453 start_codon:yes stop_codon:yes gene_type:complete
MVFYIISGLIITTIILVKLIDFIYLPQQKFKKYLKFFVISILLGIISYLIRFFPALISAIPPIFLIIYRWGPLVKFISEVFLKRKNPIFGSTQKKMTKSEAYDVLGLNPGASEKEILESYQKLMKKNHPDLGGSDWITKKLNQARDILLG